MPRSPTACWRMRTKPTTPMHPRAPIPAARSFRRPWRLRSAIRPLARASCVACNVRDADHIEKAFDFGGMPAHGGVVAASMVAHGFTGVDDVFAGERNFFEAFAPEPDPSRL